MTTILQKNSEILYATKAGELLDESWKVEASPDEISWPDLIVHTDTRKFGLEVREIYLDETKNGSVIKAHEKTNEYMVKGLSRAYYKKSCIPIIVELLGDINRQEQLLNVLVKNADRLPVLEQKRLQPYDGCVIYIRRLPEQFGEYARWTYITDRVGCVKTIDEAILNKAITIKAKNLVKYEKNISDIRLLIVSNRIYNSGKAHLRNDVMCNAHGFKAIYYLSYPDSVWSICS